MNGVITVKPNIPKKFFGDECSVNGLVLPDGCTLDVTVKDGKVTCGYDGELKIVTE